MAQSLARIYGPLGTDPQDRFNWGLWAAKWGAILIGGCVVVSAPFVLHAYVTKKPGTIWAER